MQLRRRHALASPARALGALLALLIAVPATPAVAAPIQPARIRVCIDAGHGGSYSGAYYRGTAEKTLNLAIAKKLGAELRRRNIEVVYTRTTDTKIYDGHPIKTWLYDDAAGAYDYRFWPVTDAQDRLRYDLQARCDVARASGADLFISIHCNAGGSSARGIEVYRGTNDPVGQAFANDVLAGLLARTGAVNRGAHDANFYVTRWSNTPAVLVESGFMSNPTELARLRSPWYQNQLARGIADGVEDFAARGANEPYERVWGATRYDTAVAVSKRSFPATSSAVILASGETFADSLVSAPLARKLDAPILTVPAAGLPAAVAGELARLSPDRVIVVGGEQSVPSAVASAAVSAAGASIVERLAGRDRYEVSLAVAERLGARDASAAVVASGEGFADALSIAASAAERGEPIVLASREGLTDAAVAYLAPGGTPRFVTVVGGPYALPPAAMRGLESTRLAGRTRYDTNWAVANARYGAAKLPNAMVASGETFSDALVLGPLAAREGRAVLLIGKSATGADFRPWIYDNRATTMSFTLVGGPASVTPWLGDGHEKMRMRSY